MSSNLNDSNLLLSNSALNDRAKHLENITFFKGLKVSEFTELAGIMKEINYKKNSIIIHQGDLSRSLFIVLHGRLKVFATDDEGNQTIFTFLTNGDIFGELSLLDDAPRSATVYSLEDCTLLSLDHAKFKDFIDSHPGACWPLFKSLTSRIRTMDDTICSLTSRDIYGRLIETLYKQSEKNADGVLCTQKLTHQDFAEIIGSSREMISRIFKDLKKEGYISIDKKRVSILKRLPTHW